MTKFMDIFGPACAWWCDVWQRRRGVAHTRESTATPAHISPNTTLALFTLSLVIVEELEVGADE